MTFGHIDARERRAINQAFLRFLPILIVTSIIVSVLISYNYFINKQHSIIDQQQSEIVTAMITYRNSISDMTSIVHTIKIDYIDQLGNDPSAVEALLMSTMQQYTNIAQLHVLDTAGMETMHLERINSDVVILPAGELQDKSHQSYFVETAMLGRHHFLFSGLNLCKENGSIVTDIDTSLPIPILRISTPLEMGGIRIGYFITAFQMRDYLETLRGSLKHDGCHVLLLDENGFLYNDSDDNNNFGFCYEKGSAEYNRTIRNLFPNIDLTVESGSLIENNAICSYTAFSNIYDRSKDYFLSSAAPKKLIFLIYYDDNSEYIHYLKYSFYHHLADSWEMQIIVPSILLLLYIFTICMVFYYDRIRFTDLFSYNRYTKAALKQALRHHQFVNYYQPIINIQNGTVLGFETLCRWEKHGKILAPAQFMDEILHYQLGQKIDENAFTIMREDHKKLELYPEFKDTFISINCCQQTFNSLIKEPPSTIIRLTEEEKAYVVLELVENIIFNRSTQDKISEMYRRNILFAIDDFGTGNSNIAFIRNLENLKVKIDRAFVPINPADHKERIIIESFVKMFIDQGLRLIVEGVETREQCLYMRGLGISGVQGFYFSKPMTIDQLIEFMQKKDYLNKL